MHGCRSVVAIVWVASSALCGCEVVFPLEPPDDGSIVDELAVRGTLIDHVVSNKPDGTGEPLVTSAPLPVATLVGRVDFDDGTAATVAFRPDGTFSFPVPASGARYRLTTTIGGQVRELQGVANTLTLSQIRLGRPDRMPVAKPTLVTFPAPGGSSPTVVTTGIWTSTGTPGFNETTNELDWASAVPSPGAGFTGLLDKSRGDFLYYISFTAVADSVSGQFYSVINSVLALQVDVLDGMAITVPGVPNGLALEHCINVKAERALELKRLTVEYPSEGLIPLVADWVVYALPVPSLGALGAQLIAFESQSGTFTDAALQVQLTNFYPGTSLFGALDVSLLRKITLPGTTSAARRVGSQTIVGMELGSGCDAVTAIAGIPGLAGGFSVAGTALTGNFMPVSFERGHHVVDVSFAVSGTSDVFDVSLLEVSSELGSTKLQLIHTTTTTLKLVAFEENLFQANHFYMIEVSARRGFPRAAEGDFDTVSYPAGEVTTSSTVFRVIQ